MYIHPDLRFPLGLVATLLGAWVLTITTGLPVLVWLLYAIVVGMAAVVAIGTAALTIYVFCGLLWSLIKAFGSTPY